MVKSPLDLIDIKTIREENIVPFSSETIRRYFRAGVFHVHDRRSEDGTTIVTYRGSLRIRYQIFKKIARQNKSRKIPIDEAGKLMREICGDEDEFVLGRIKKGISDSVAIDELFDTAKHLLEAKHK